MRIVYGLLVCALILTCSCGTNNSNGGTTTAATNSTPVAPPPPPPPPPQLAVWSNQFSGVPFTMVGTDPSIAGAGTTNVPVVIIPVALSFSAAGVLLSPNNAACGDNVSAVSRVQNSPLFTSTAWSDGSIQIGNTQFPDAFQRANFWHFVNTVSPNYHVMLDPVSVLPTVTFEVPLNIGATLQANPICPSSALGGVPTSFMDNIVSQVVQSQHITANTLPIFLTYDMVFAPSNQEIFFGYHNRQGSQTYIVASYTDPSFNLLNNVLAFDTTILSHEIAEWMDDPLGTNIVPPWGSFGIQQSCGSVLEVGDPLTGSTFAVPTSTFTYHIQELAYFSWFARNVPSLAINGRYSTRGTFVTPAPPC